MSALVSVTGTSIKTAASNSAAGTQALSTTTSTTARTTGSATSLSGKSNPANGKASFQQPKLKSQRGRHFASTENTSKPPPQNSRRENPPNQRQGGKPPSAKPQPPSTQRDRDRDVTLLMNDQSWVDRVAKELKGQREWSEKWAFVNDPKLYMGEQAPSNFCGKPQPTKWSAYSIINSPSRNPLATRPVTPEGYVPPTFKVQHDPQTGQPLAHTNAPYHRQRPDPASQTSNSSVRVTPAHQNAPFSTHPEPSPTRISSQNRVHMSSFNASFGRSYVRTRQNPQECYNTPATTNQEYGWVWGGRKSMELYGSTSANYAKESWKRAGLDHRA